MPAGHLREPLARRAPRPMPCSSRPATRRRPIASRARSRVPIAFRVTRALGVPAPHRRRARYGRRAVGVARLRRRRHRAARALRRRYHVDRAGTWSRRWCSAIIIGSRDADIARIAARARAVRSRHRPDDREGRGAARAVRPRRAADRVGAAHRRRRAGRRVPRVAPRRACTPAASHQSPATNHRPPTANETPPRIGARARPDRDGARDAGAAGSRVRHR